MAVNLTHHKKVIRCSDPTQYRAIQFAFRKQVCVLSRWKVGYRPMPLTNNPINIGDSGYRVLVGNDKIFDILKFNTNGNCVLLSFTHSYYPWIEPAVLSNKIKNHCYDELHWHCLHKKKLSFISLLHYQCISLTDKYRNVAEINLQTWVEGF